MNAATFCPKVLASDSCSVGEPLTLHTFQGSYGTGHVADTQLLTIVLAAAAIMTSLVAGGYLLCNTVLMLF